MKAILVTLIAVLFWVLLGHFFPSLSISLTAFYLPIVFVVIAITVGKQVSKYLYTVICFVLILLYDYLFRLYGGGIHDDAGRGICEIVFYATLVTSTIALLCIKILDTSKRNELNAKNKLNAKKILLDIIFVLALSVITLLFFRRFNISI
jgi:hypothetical protein